MTDLAGLVPGKYGIPEPDESVRPEARRTPGKGDCIAVPGLAFTRQGARLGRGAGYYDRFLQGAGEALKVGLAFDIQLLAKIPEEALDVRMDFVVSESGVISCSAPGGS